MKYLTSLCVSLVLMASCALPNLVSNSHAGIGRVVAHTPYGKEGRVLLQNDYFQSTLVPVDLEAQLDHFVITLTNTQNAGDTRSQTLSVNDMASFAFDEVPQGTWNLQVDALNVANKLIARALLAGASALSVQDGQTTDVGLISVQPVRGIGTGRYELRLNGIPSDVSAATFDLQRLTVNSNGSIASSPVSFSVNNESSPLRSDGPVANGNGTRTLVVRNGTSSALAAGTYQLTIRFQGVGIDTNGLSATFQPVFTVEVYNALTSSLTVNLATNWLGEADPPSPPSALSVEGDLVGELDFSWYRAAAGPTFISHYQVAVSVAGDNLGAPNLADVVTLPNVNNLMGWHATYPGYGAVRLYDTNQPFAGSGGATFWVRAVSRGVRASSWSKVTMTAGAVSYDPVDLYVSKAGSDTTGTGSKANPVATLAKALELAQAQGNPNQMHNIRMGVGSYSSGSIGFSGSMNPVPISIYGSYNPGFASRSVLGSPTVLVDTNPSESGNNSGNAFLNLDQSGFNFPLNQVLDGVQFETIQSATSGEIRTVRLKNWANVTVNDVTITATGQQGGSAYGLQIVVPTGPAAKSILVQHTKVVMTDLDQTMSNLVALSLEGASGDPVTTTAEVRNSVLSVSHVYGGSLVSALAAFGGATNSLTLRNNTLVTDFRTSDPGPKVAIKLSTSSPLPLQADNNLIVNLTDTTGTAVLVYQDGNDSVFRNNVFSGYTDPVYSQLSTSGRTIAILNAGGVFPTSSGNLGAGTGTVAFVAPNSGNFNLTSGITPSFILGGGLNGSADAPAWPFADDVNGYARTPPWSVGAYEVDTAVGDPMMGLALGDGGGNDNWILALSNNGDVFIAGQGSRLGSVPHPEGLDPIPGVSGVTQVVVGAHASYLLLNNGTVLAAGNNANGQLGMGDTSDRNVFTLVPGLSNIVKLSAGADTVFALDDNGNLYAAGWNNYGQAGLANGANLGADNYTSFALSQTGVADAAVGYYSSALVKTDGTAWIAGSGHSATGWVQVLDSGSNPLVGMTTVACSGSDFLLLIDSSGQLWTQGNAPTGSSSWAQPVAGFTGVKAVATTADFMLVLKTDDTLWYAGTNSFYYFNSGWQTGYGLIGNGDTGASPITVLTPVATDVLTMAAGEYQWGLVKNDGSLWVNGSNGASGLGLGFGVPYVSTLTPAQFY